jgi:hypothetical protein
MVFLQPHSQHKPTPSRCCAFSRPEWPRGVDGAGFYDGHDRHTKLNLSVKITLKFRVLYQINPNTRKPSANVDNAAREKLSVLSTVIPIA